MAVFLICLLVISGCRANTTDIEIAQIDEIAREIIYSYNTEKIKGKTYQFTGTVSSIKKNEYVNIPTSLPCDDDFYYRLKISLTDEDVYNELQEGSIIKLQADFDYHPSDSNVIFMSNGSIIEINNDNVTAESEIVNSTIQSSDNDKSSKEEQSRLLEESRLLEQSIAEQSRLLEESRLQEESRLLEMSRAEQSRLLEQSRLQEESRLREQSKAQQMHDFTFILNVDSGVYHLHECSASKRMKDENKRYVTKTAATQYEARQQIEAEGYRVCGICTR